MRLFTKAKPKTTARDAILQLRETLELLEKREKYLQSRMDKEVQVAKLNASKNKRVALMALKRSKKYEGELDKIGGMRTTIENQMGTIEDASFNYETIHALQTGAQALKTIHGDMNIEKVDNIVDEIREQSDIANEISTAISQPITGAVDIDDEELMDELRAMEQEELDSKLLGVEKAPINKAKEPIAAQVPRPMAGTEIDEDEERELEMLKASMAM